MEHTENTRRTVCVPGTEELEAMLEQEKYLTRYRRTLMNTICIMIAVAAAAVIVSMLILPTVQIYGTSMSPTVGNGDIVISLANGDLKRGDVIAFYYNNKVLAKRVIAFSGEWVDIDDEGNVYVDSEKLDEPYLTETAQGECSIELPYQVPEGMYFVMGDHRSVSLDSRDAVIGCVSDEMIVGKLEFRIWPLTKFGTIN